MLSKIITARDRIIRLLFGYDKNKLEVLVGQTITLEDTLKTLLKEVERVIVLSESYLDKHKQLSIDVEKVFNLLKANRDNTEMLRNKLWAVRETTKYKEVFNNKHPLISVRIATYNKPDKLVDVAIKSVLNQTYQNFEIIVIGDNCSSATEEKILKLKNKKIRYINLPQRSLYPDDAHHRWQVAGSPGMNLGAYLAKGDWIAPLDDDDEFTPDHLEKLLAEALSKKSEMVYGALIQKNTLTGDVKKIWSSPPEASKFSFQGAMYMKQLGFFEYDQQSWVVEEPGDWNLCRRMQLAGVRMSAISDVIGTMYATPYTHKKS